MFSAAGASGNRGASAGASAQLRPPELVDSDLAGSATIGLEEAEAGLLGLAVFFFLAGGLGADFVKDFFGAGGAFFLGAGLEAGFAFFEEFFPGLTPEALLETAFTTPPVGLAGPFFKAAADFTARS